MRADVHVLLVSAQAAPNLLPTLDPELRPREAVLVVSGKMQKRADHLERVLREAGVRTTRVDVVNEHDLTSLEEAFLGIAEAKGDQERVALNLTGGTKLMALAALNVAGSAGWASFYVDVDTDQAIPLDKTQPTRSLAPTLGLSHYLQAYGFRKEKLATPPLDVLADELMQTLVTQVGSLERPLGQLNWLAQEAEMGRRLTVPMNSDQLDSLSLTTLLRDFEDARLLQVQGETLRFANEAARSFTKGGWLERHVFRRVAALRDALGIRDQETNLQLVDDEEVRNELDVAFIARNRLFVIECKTARMDGDRAPKANDSLFKLSEVCRRVGGLGTRAMLVSYRRLGDAERRLAGALGIEVVSGAEITNFDHRLRVWVQP